MAVHHSAIRMKGLPDATTPEAGTFALYVGGDGKVYVKDSAGVITQVGASAGGSDLNLDSFDLMGGM